MKKVMCVVLSMIMLCIITSCSGGTSKKAFEEGKLAIAGKEYDKALNYLELAKDEGNKDPEIEMLIETIKNYQTAKEELEAANIDGANAAIDLIPTGYENYAISKDIDDLKAKIVQRQADMTDADLQISGTKKFIASGDYESAETNIAELYSKSLTDYQRQQVDEMSATIKSAKNKISEAENKKPDVIYVNGAGQNSYSDYSSLISNRTTSEVESYINGYVRPLYNEVQANLKNYSSTKSGGITYWQDSKGIIKMQLSANTNNYGMAREYFYDTDSGRIAFAFVYSGNSEYRYYFRTNQLVRYIGPNGKVINNPKSDDILKDAARILSEAY